MNSVNFEKKQLIPSKIVCIGRNYVEHIKELQNEVPKEPVVFLKPNSSITNQLSSFLDEPIHYEGELCFLIQNNSIAAVGFGLDLTKRELQSNLKKKGLPWERAKAFNGSALFSEFKKLDSITNDLSLELKIDSETVQHGGVELMMRKPEELLEYVSSFMTLEDGDILMTGTPRGVGEIKNGQTFQGSVVLGKEQIVTAKWNAI